MKSSIDESMYLPEYCNCNQLRRAARRVSRYYDQCLASTGLKATQFALLGYLQTEGPMTMVGLADHLAMDRATVGHNLRPLERDGLVEIAVSPTDRRARIVAISDRGVALMLSAQAAWQKAQAEFETAVGRSDTATMRKLTAQIADAPFAPVLQRG